MSIFLFKEILTPPFDLMDSTICPITPSSVSPVTRLLPTRLLRTAETFHLGFHRLPDYFSLLLHFFRGPFSSPSRSIVFITVYPSTFFSVFLSLFNFSKKTKFKIIVFWLVKKLLNYSFLVPRGATWYQRGAT